MREEVFFLVYAGLRGTPDAWFDMDVERRRWFVERLEKQKEFERAEIDKGKK